MKKTSFQITEPNYLAEAFQHIATLTNFILTEAPQKGAADFNKDGQIIGINEVAFPREIKVLKELTDSLPYHEFFIKWAQDCTLKLTRRLTKEYPYEKFADEWQRHRAQSDRLTLLNYMGLPLKEVFWDTPLSSPISNFVDTQNLHFPKAETKSYKGKDRTLGYVVMNYSDMMQKGIFPALHINEELLQNDNPREALSVWYHEHMHFIVGTVMMAHHYGYIPEHHSFAQVARHEAEKIKNKAIIPGSIYSAYRSQASEIFCHTLQGLFSIQYKSSAPIKERAYAPPSSFTP